MKLSKKNLVKLLASVLAIVAAVAAAVDGLPDFDFSGPAPAPVATPAADAGVSQ